MQYKILASDYDNTLMPFGEAKPRPAVVKAVKKLQAAGGKFVLSTGRSYPGIRDKNQLGGIRYDYAITCNGACVVDRQGNVIAEHPLTSEEMYVLVDFCEDYNYPLQFNFRDAYYAYCEYEYLHTGYQMMNSPGLDCVDGEDQDRHLLDMPHAAFAAMPPQEVERFHEKYGYLGLHWMQTGAQNADGYCYYDIVRGGMDKGVGLADLCAQMGLTLADAVAVGDSANDVGMLKVAGLSACMANGTPDAKAAADRIIGDVREDGVAALIEELWFNGGADRGAAARAGGYRRQKAAAFAPRAGAVGYAGKLHHHRGIGCFHPGCGAQRYRRAAAQSAHPGGVLQRCHSLPYLYKISAAAYRHPGCPSAQYKSRQRRLQPRPAGGALGRCTGGLDRKMMTRL